MILTAYGPWNFAEAGPLRDEVLTGLHEGELGGHLEIEKTLDQLKERFHWPGHYQDMQNWCSKYVVCASQKSPTHSARTPLTNIKVRNPMQLVAVDILGPLTESEVGNFYILVAADYFARWVEAYPIQWPDSLPMSSYSIFLHQSSSISIMAGSLSPLSLLRCVSSWTSPKLTQLLTTHNAMA